MMAKMILTLCCRPFDTRSSHTKDLNDILFPWLSFKIVSNAWELSTCRYQIPSAPSAVAFTVPAQPRSPKVVETEIGTAPEKTATLARKNPSTQAFLHQELLVSDLSGYFLKDVGTVMSNLSMNICKPLFLISSKAVSKNIAMSAKGDRLSHN